jgi:hypothetical protein
VNAFTGLLQKAATEVRHYCATSRKVREFDSAPLLSLASDMEAASALQSDADVEHAIDVLAQAIIDSGRLTEQFAPSFGRALDALQRRRKRERRR